jgi:hypothetical protein
LPLNQPDKFEQVIIEAANWDQHSFDEWAQGAWHFAKAFIANPNLHSQYLRLFS